MLKKVSIQTAGSEEPTRTGFVVTPETTTQELLSRAKLDGYVLCPTSDELPFGEREPIFDKVAEGSMLFAYKQAVAGANAPLQHETPFIQRRGWRLEGRTLKGYYRTRYGSFEGKIRLRKSVPAECYILHPPDVFTDHKHWACFSERSGGWFSIHFDVPPKSLDDAIKSIESIGGEAFKKSIRREQLWDWMGISRIKSALSDLRQVTLFK